MKKNIFFLGMAALALAACSGNPYDEWSSAQHSDPEAAKTVTLNVAPAAAIDFATLTADSVQLFVPTVTAENGAVNTYTVVLNNEDQTATQTVTASENGMVATSDLQTAYYTLIGRRPVQRTIGLDITAYSMINGESIKNEGSTTATLTASAPVIESRYYVTGNINGWNNSDTTYPVVNGGGDVYDDPVFTVTLPATGSDIEFKLTPESGLGGDWTGCITAAKDGTEGKVSDSNAGGNLVITNDPDAKFYRVTFDLLNQTWSYTSLSFNEYIYEIGGESGWSTNHALYGANSDGNYLGYYYLNGEFKFKPNADNWNDDWEYDGEGKIADNGGPNIPDPGAGYYRIAVNTVTLTYSLLKVNSISMIGTVNGNWDTDTDLTYNVSDDAWEWTGQLNAGEVKFRVNHDWAYSWGGKDGNAYNFNNLTENNGQNLKIDEAGTYKVTLTVHQENGDCKVSFEKQ